MSREYGVEVMKPGWCLAQGGYGGDLDDDVWSLWLSFGTLAVGVVVCGMDGDRGQDFPQT